jgi:hypothetical protein
MEVQDLLQLRYKVIADYPQNHRPVGSVIEIDENAYQDKGIRFMCERHPHLFKKLEWWEERKGCELPQYVKTGGRVFEVDEYEDDKDHGLMVWFKNHNPVVGAAIHAQVFPATKEEYENQ